MEYTTNCANRDIDEVTAEWYMQQREWDSAANPPNPETLVPGEKVQIDVKEVPYCTSFGLFNC